MKELSTEGKDCLTCKNLNPTGQHIGTGVYGKRDMAYDTCGGFPRYDREGLPPTPTKLCRWIPSDQGATDMAGKGD